MLSPSPRSSSSGSTAVATTRACSPLSAMHRRRDRRLVHCGVAAYAAEHGIPKGLVVDSAAGPRAADFTGPTQPRGRPEAPNHDDEDQDRRDDQLDPDRLPQPRSCAAVYLTHVARRPTSVDFPHMRLTFKSGTGRISALRPGRPSQEGLLPGQAAGGPRSRECPPSARWGRPEAAPCGGQVVPLAVQAVFNLACAALANLDGVAAVLAGRCPDHSARPCSGR